MARYQYGSLMKRRRKNGPDVWQFRWIENGRRKSVIIGPVEKLPNKADAERAVEHLRMKINADNHQQQFRAVTVGALIDRFEAEYVPKHCRRLTKKTYASLFQNHIRPKWASFKIADVHAMHVQEWLDSYPTSRQIKSHVRTLMHTMFQAAMFWELVDRNPISLIRQPRKRLKQPRVLTVEELNSLAAELKEPFRTMVVVAACLGLRVSELIGLQWQDIDFENQTVSIRRSVVEGEVNETKTVDSESTLPLNSRLAALLLAHRMRQNGPALNDWVFTGPTGKPPWPDSILAKQLKPAAARAGLGNIGWHTFRHTYSTMLHSMRTVPAVQKELLRHADVSTTLNIYTQAVSKEKIEANSMVVDKLLAQLVPSGTFEGKANIN